MTQFIIYDKLNRKENKKMTKINYSTLEQDILNFNSKTTKELFNIYKYLSKFFSKKLFNQYNYNTIIDKEDFRQIADIALWQTIEKYDPAKQVKFSTFAFIKMQNIIKDEIRRATRSRAKGSIKSNQILPLELQNLDVRDERNFTNKEQELTNAILDILNKSRLSKKSIDIFTAFILEGISQKELAKRYGVTSSMISKYVSDVKKYLRKNKKNLNY